MLHYILLQRNGDIYGKLIKCLHHHSLAQLMVELLQVKITATTSNSTLDRFIFSDKNRGGDSEEDDEPATKLTPLETKMLDILNVRRQEVVLELIERLSSKNTDFENCLNAHSILLELTDNEAMFGKLVDTQNISKLINCACDIRNPNQSYALNILTSIIKEYPNYEKHLGETVSQEFQMTITKQFQDITYTCLMMLRSSDKQLGEVAHEETLNQAGMSFKRFGLKRMRAMELLKQEI